MAATDLYRKILNHIEDGDWHGAHRRVQSLSDRRACLIHAYLHRLEGDQANAGYWYGRAGERLPANTLEQEWERLSDLIKGD